MLAQQLINGLSVGGIYALLSTGYALIYSLLGFSNWAHGEVAMLGAYIAVMSVITAKLPFVASLALALAGAALISLVNEKFFYRHIRNNNSPTMFLMIAAMGLSTTYKNLIVVLVGPKFKYFPQILPFESLEFWGINIGVLDIFSIIVSLAAIVLLDILIYHTKFGLGIRGCASDSVTAELLGVNVNRYILIVFLLAGGLAGCAGVLLGMKYTVYPSLGNTALKAFIASVFGGLGSIRGAIMGAFMIGILETLVSAYVSSGLRDLFTFGLLIAILLIRPEGLLGKSVEQKS